MCVAEGRRGKGEGERRGSGGMTHHSRDVLLMTRAIKGVRNYTRARENGGSEIFRPLAYTTKHEGLEEKKGKKSKG